MLSINESGEWCNDVCNECLVSLNQVNDVCNECLVSMNQVNDVMIYVMNA